MPLTLMLLRDHEAEHQACLRARLLAGCLLGDSAEHSRLVQKRAQRPARIGDPRLVALLIELVERLEIGLRGCADVNVAIHISLQRMSAVIPSEARNPSFLHSPQE